MPEAVALSLPSLQAVRLTLVASRAASGHSRRLMFLPVIGAVRECRQSSVGKLKDARDSLTPAIEAIALTGEGSALGTGAT